LGLEMERLLWIRDVARPAVACVMNQVVVACKVANSTHQPHILINDCFSVLRVVFSGVRRRVRPNTVTLRL
jgi:hypothetical protein